MSDPAIPEGLAATPILMQTRVKAMLYALMLLSIAIFSFTESNLAPLTLAAIAAAVAWLVVDSPRPSSSSAAPPQPAKGWWAWLLTRKGRGAPTLLLNLFVLGGSVYLFIELLDALGNRSLITGLTHFIIILAICKLFEEKTMRDIVQLVVLSMLVVVSSAMFSNSSIVFALLLAIYVGLLTYCVLLLHLGAESQAVMQRKVPASLPDPAHLLRVRTDLRFIARNCGLLIVPLAVVVFLLMPRIRGPGFTSSWNVGPYQTGFNDNGVQFHEVGQLTTSDEIAMTVSITRADGDYSPDSGDLYFRGQVLTEYYPGSNDSRAGREAGWRPERDDREAQSAPTDSSWIRNQGEFSHEVYTLSFPLLRAPGVPSFPRFVRGPILPPGNPNLAYSAGTTTLRDVGNGVGTRTYAVDSPPLQDWSDLEVNKDIPAFLDPGVLRPAGTSHLSNRVFPEVRVSPQIMALARDLAKDYLPPEGQPIPTQSIRLVMNVYEAYLRTHYPYSLMFQHVDPTLDPTTDFLINHKASGGHCEYFASAMVMLCRAVGLNARMVTGYHGGEYNVFLRQYLIRQKDAHAWAEVYIPGQGWVLSDPSPIQTNAAALGDLSLWRWGREFGQMLENYWTSLVVTFDNDSRYTLLAQLGSFLQSIGGYFHDLVTITNVSDFLLRLAVFGPLLGLFILIGWGVKRWRADRRKLRDARGSPWRAMVALSGGIWFMDELFALLERYGEPRRMDQTPREYLEQFIGQLRNASSDARWLITLGYEVRFGELEIDSSLRGRVNSSLRRVKMALHA